MRLVSVCSSVAAIDASTSFNISKNGRNSFPEMRYPKGSFSTLLAAIDDTFVLDIAAALRHMVPNYGVELRLREREHRRRREAEVQNVIGQPGNCA
jgi:hypothetical protein